MDGQEDDQRALLASGPTERNTTEESEAPPVRFGFQLDQPTQSTHDMPLRARFGLYASHALSTWGQRMWEFAVGLIMLDLYPSSLALVSAFGLVDGLAKMLSGSMVGSYIDR